MVELRWLPVNPNRSGHLQMNGAYLAFTLHTHHTHAYCSVVFFAEMGYLLSFLSFFVATFLSSYKTNMYSLLE